MATTGSPSSSRPSRPTYSCIRCADRKVKCDRQRPCSACVKHNVDCIFNPSPPPRMKRHKCVQDQTLTARIRHYEALLQKHGIDPGNLPDTPDSEPGRSINKTQIVHGQGRSQFVDNSLWSRVVEEFHDPEDALEYSSSGASNLEASDDEFSYVLTCQQNSNVRSRHPPPERIDQLFQIYIENVDPLTKAVHAPTLRPAIQKAANNIRSVPRSFEALMYAIYGAAVMSMTDDDCRQRLGEARKTLLSRYVSATKVALARAKFMSTISLVVLQALVLHILSVRDIYEPRAVWSLTGVAIRIAQSMGLERDGLSLGFPPFETEMRRRVWWLLKTHDFRTAELCGLAKFRDLDMGVDSTKWPTNVNDDQLYPGMPSLPTESNTITDTVFIALRYELASFAAGRVARFRQQGMNPNQYDLRASGSDKAEIDQAFREAEETIETKYIRYCDPSQPLHLMTMLTARSAMNFIRFLTYHPRKWASIEETPLSERQMVFEISLKLVEQHNMLQSNPQLKQFAWHAAYFLQWHAFIHVLDTLRANPLTKDAEKAWQLIGNTYENNPSMVFDTRKPVHVAVGNLCLKAYGVRETTMQHGKPCHPPIPEFILQLRQQRAVAQAKKQARDAKNTQHENPVGHGQANAGVAHSANLQQITVSHPRGLAQTGGATESDLSWYVSGFDDSKVGDGLNDAMEIHVDSMLVQDYSVEENATQTAFWEQWDALLAESNIMRPLSP